MSFCFLYNLVSENYSVQNSSFGGVGSMAWPKSTLLDFMYLTNKTDFFGMDVLSGDSSLSKYFVSLPDRGLPLNKSICIPSCQKSLL